MFLGTTPSCVRDYLASELTRNTPKRLFEPFAGNFVMSLVCGAIDKKIEVISGDVSIYSVALGKAFAGEDSGIRLTEQAIDRIPYFRNKESPVEIAATVMIWDELAPALAKQHIRYYGSMVKNIEQNIDAYMKQLTDRIEKVKKTLGRFQFHAQDACKTIAEANGPDDFMLYDPPYWVGGYEKLYAQLVQHFSVPEIPYTQITDDLKRQQMEELRQRDVRVFFRAEDPISIPGYQTVYEYLYKPNGKRYFLLTNQDAKPAHGWREMLRTKKAKHNVLWGKDLTKDMKAELIPVSRNIGNYYRQLWTKKATMRDAGDMWLAVVGGKVCGVVSIMTGMYGNGNAVIVSDAAPLHTPYKRLGKLVLMMVLNDEFIQNLSRHFMTDFSAYVTAAYSDNPVSMKYRGLMELTDRTKGGPGEHKFILKYRAPAPFANKTVQSGYEKWYKQYGEATNAR